MNFIFTLLILLFILGFIVFFHELGHFIAAKKSGVYVDEFALGMGPNIFSFKKKETTYTLRILPIGGYVSMANEENPELKLPKERILANKKFYQKILVLTMGIIFNFILAFLLFFLNGVIFGSPETKPYIGQIAENSPAEDGGLLPGDLVLSVNGTEVNSWDDVLLELTVKSSKQYKIKVERLNTIFITTIEPRIETDEDGNTTKIFGIATNTIKNEGIVNAIKYSWEATSKITRNIFKILGNLFTGKLSTKNLSGPVGIYSVVDDLKENGLESIIYLIGYLSLNVGIINLIPIPVFDGGRILLVIIEKIKRKKLNPNVELYLNYIGFGLMILLMIFVTYNDIIKLL